VLLCLIHALRHHIIIKNNKSKNNMPRYSATLFLAALLANNAFGYQTEVNDAALGASSGALHDLFENWTLEFSKNYHSIEEKLKRKAIWLENHAYIMLQNSREEHTFELGHNEFSDMTFDEFKQYFHIGEYGLLRQKEGPSEEAMEAIEGEDEQDTAVQRKLRSVKSEDEDESPSSISSDLPESVDWVAGGAVTMVKNQGMCGSCWAFSAVGAIEGAYFLKTGELVDLSEQQLVDCDINGGPEGDNGCKGGLMDNAFDYVSHEDGLCTYDDYPYVGKQGTCNTSCSALSGTKVDGFVDIKAQDNQAMMEALAVQPVSIAIEADQLIFQFYRSGVFNYGCGTNLDHGVLAVGYGTDPTGGEYYTVKNSWGAGWGESGFIRLKRDMAQAVSSGTCGMLLMSSRPYFGEP